jgi:hypothetical protein
LSIRTQIGSTELTFDVVKRTGTISGTNERFYKICMRLIIASLLVGSCLPKAHTQPLLQELGGGVNPQGVTVMYVDTAEDRLLLAGAFTYANGVQVSPGILQWDDAGFTSVGCGVEWDCVSFINQAGLANRAFAVVGWRNEIYLRGNFFFTRNGIEHNFIMRWDGTSWTPLGSGPDGPVKSIKVIDDQLIVAGWFTYADTVLCNGLARWDGEAWHRLLEVPPFYIGDGPNQIQDVVKFQDQWYIGGNLPLVDDIARWNGGEWEIVGGGITGAVSQVNMLHVYEDRLYVAGGFSQCPPTGNPANPGSGVVAWDGANWDALGGGTCGSSNGTVLGMTWWNDELYVAGIFNRIGDVPGGKLAKWDGNEWCMLAPLNHFGNGSPGALAVYHDSLYVGGAFVEVGGEPMSCFGKWIGGEHTEGCGVLTGLEEESYGTTSFQAVMDVGTGSLVLKGLPQAARSVEVLDMLGRRVSVRTASGSSIPVADLAVGHYVVVVLDGQGVPLASARFVRY